MLKFTQKYFKFKNLTISIFKHLIVIRLLFIISFICTSNSNITIVKDPHNPIVINNYYLGRNNNINLRFKVIENTNFLFFGNYIVIKLPYIDLNSLIDNNNKEILNSNNSFCKLYDSLGNVYNTVYDPIYLNYKTKNSQETVFSCKFLDNKEAVGGDIYYNIYFSFNFYIPYQFTSNIELLIMTGGDYDKSVIYGHNPSFDIIGQYNDYKSKISINNNNSKEFILNSVDIVPKSGPCLIETSQCNDVYYNNLFGLKFEIISNFSFLDLRYHGDIVFEIDNNLKAVNDSVKTYNKKNIDIVTETLDISNILINNKDMNEDILPYVSIKPNSNIYRLESLDISLTKNDVLTFTIYNFTSKGTNLNKNLVISMKVYWKNTFSIISYYDYKLVGIKYTEIYSSINHAENWDIYENASWPINIKFTLNNSLDKSVYVLIKHNNPSNSSILKFIPSTCNFTNFSINQKNKKLQSIKCFSLNNNEQTNFSKDNIEVYSKTGSGIIFKPDFLESNVEYNLTVWIMFISCSNQDINNPKNIADNNNNYNISEFSISVYKDIEYINSQIFNNKDSIYSKKNKHYNTNFSLSNYILKNKLAKSNVIKLGSKCFSNLIYKNSFTQSFEGVYSNFITYDYASTKKEVDFLLFKEVHNFSLISQTEKYIDLFSISKSNFGYLFSNTYEEDSDQKTLLNNYFHVNIPYEIPPLSYVYNYIPMPLYQNNKDSNVYIKNGTFSLYLQKEYFTSDIVKSNRSDCAFGFGGIFPNEDSSNNQNIIDASNIEINKSNVYSYKHNLNTNNLKSDNINIDLEKSDFLVDSTFTDKNNNKKIFISTNMNNSKSSNYFINSTNKNSSSSLNFKGSLSFYTDCYVYKNTNNLLKNLYTHFEVLVVNYTNSNNQKELYPHRVTRIISFVNNALNSITNKNYSNIEVENNEKYFRFHNSFVDSKYQSICLIEINNQLFIDSLSNYNYNKVDNISLYNTLTIYLNNISLLNIDVDDNYLNYPIPLQEDNQVSVSYNSSIYRGEHGSLFNKFNEQVNTIQQYDEEYYSKIHDKMYSNSSSSEIFRNYYNRMGNVIHITGFDNLSNFINKGKSIVIPVNCLNNINNNENTNVKYINNPTIGFNFNKFSTNNVNLYHLETILKPSKNIVFGNNKLSSFVLIVKNNINKNYKIISTKLHLPSYNFSDNILVKGINNYLRLNFNENKDSSNINCSGFSLALTNNLFIRHNEKLTLNLQTLNKLSISNNKSNNNDSLSDTETKNNAILNSFNVLKPFNSINFYINGVKFSTLLLTSSFLYKDTVNKNSKDLEYDILEIINNKFMNYNYISGIKRPDISLFNQKYKKNYCPKNQFYNEAAFFCNSFKSETNILATNYNTIDTNIHDVFNLEFNDLDNKNIIESSIDSIDNLDNSKNSSDNNLIITKDNVFNIINNWGYKINKFSQDKFYLNDKNFNVNIVITSPLLIPKYSVIIIYFSNHINKLTNCGLSHSEDSNKIDNYIANDCLFSEKFKDNVSYSTMLCNIPFEVSKINQELYLCCSGLSTMDIQTNKNLSNNKVKIFYIDVKIYPYYIISEINNNQIPITFDINSFYSNQNYIIPSGLGSLIDEDSNQYYLIPNTTSTEDFSRTTIASITFSHTNQNLGFGVLYIELYLHRKPIRNSEIIIEGDFSNIKFKNKENIISKCWFTFNNDLINFNPKSIELTKHLKPNKNIETGDFLVESCIVNLTSIILKFKNLVFKCGLQDLSQRILISINPVNNFDFSSASKNQYKITWKINNTINDISNDIYLVNPKSTSNIIFPNPDFKITTAPLISNKENLCDIIRIMPKTVNDIATYEFKINIPNDLSAFRNNIRNTKVGSKEYEIYNSNFNYINDISIFLPQDYFQQNIDIICSIKTNKTIERIICMFNNEGILNFKIKEIKIENFDSSLNIDNKVDSISIIVSGITNPLIDSNFYYPCSINFYNNNSGIRTNIITGFGSLIKVIPLCHSILVSNLQGNINIIPNDKYFFSSSFTPVNKSKLNIRFTLDTTQDLVNLPVPLYNEPVIIITFPVEFNLEESESRINIDSFLEYESLGDALSHVESINSPTINNFEVLGNQIILYFRDNSRVLFSKFKFWEAQISGITNPWHELYSSSLIKITLTNSNCDFIFRTYGNMSRQLGQKNEYKNIISEISYNNNGYSDMIKFYGFDNYKESISNFINDFNFHIRYTRGYTYTYNNTKKILITFNNNKETILNAGRYKIVEFNVDKTSKYNGFTNIFIRKEEEIKNKSYMLFGLKPEIVSISTGIEKDISALLGCSCLNFEGTYLLLLKLSNIEEFHEIPPLYIKVLNNPFNKALITFHAYNDYNFTSPISKLASEPNSKLLFYIHSSELVYESLKFIFKPIENKDNNFKDYVSENIIHSGLNYNTFKFISSKNRKLGEVSKFEVSYIMENSDKINIFNNYCFEFNALDDKNIILFYFNKYSILDFSNINFGEESFEYINNKDNFSITFNSLNIKVSSAQTPVYVFCTLTCEGYELPNNTFILNHFGYLDDSEVNYDIKEKYRQYDIFDIHKKDYYNLHSINNIKFFGTILTDTNHSNIFNYLNLYRDTQYNLKCLLVPTSSNNNIELKEYKSINNKNLHTINTEKDKCVQIQFTYDPKLDLSLLLSSCQSAIITQNKNFENKGCFICKDSNLNYANGYIKNISETLKKKKCLNKWERNKISNYFINYKKNLPNEYYEDDFIQNNPNSNRLLYSNKILNSTSTLYKNKKNSFFEFEIYSRSVQELDYSFNKKINYVFSICIEQLKTCNYNNIITISGLINKLFNILNDEEKLKKNLNFQSNVPIPEYVRSIIVNTDMPILIGKDIIFLGSKINKYNKNKSNIDNNDVNYLDIKIGDKGWEQHVFGKYEINLKVQTSNQISYICNWKIMNKDIIKNKQDAKEEYVPTVKEIITCLPNSIKKETYEMYLNEYNKKEKGLIYNNLINIKEPASYDCGELEINESKIDYFITIVDDFKNGDYNMWFTCYYNIKNLFLDKTKPVSIQTYNLETSNYYYLTNSIKNENNKNNSTSDFSEVINNSGCNTLILFEKELLFMILFLICLFI